MGRYFHLFVYDIRSQVRREVVLESVLQVKQELDSHLLNSEKGDRIVILVDFD